MFGRRTTVVSITKYLDSYQQVESLPQKLYKSLSASFLKAVRKIEDEVVEKLQEGNAEDTSCHEDYVLSFIEEPLKTQIYSHVNRGLKNTYTIQKLKNIMTDSTYTALVENLEKSVKKIYVQPNNSIFDPNNPESVKWAGGYYVEDGVQKEIEFLDSVDMLGVGDHAYVNDLELGYDRVQIVSQSACVICEVTFNQITDAVKALNTTQEEMNNVLSFLLARRARQEKERQRKVQEEEQKKQDANRKHLADWGNFLRDGDIANVSRYVNGGFDINSDIGMLRDKPIILAMSSRSTELLKLLCEKGADINSQNENGTTALHVCCQIGWIDGIILLMSRGAQLIADKQGNLPTHVAAQQDSVEVIEELVRMKNNGNSKIDWYVKNGEGETVVDCCVSIALKKIIVPKGELGYNISR